MEIKTIEVGGLHPAIHAMRNPMNSWDKSDSAFQYTFALSAEIPLPSANVFVVGDNDKDLSLRLQKAGPEHCKHLRMVMVWADITAPRYWWTEFDTYRAGVEKVSCSTMHKLMARPLTPEDFESDRFPCGLRNEIIDDLNCRMNWFREEVDPETQRRIWRGIIQALPQSYLQKRTVMMSYAAIRNIYRQRKGHKLQEWEQFRSWAESLPESWMITE